MILKTISYKNILIYDVAYKTPYGAKPLRIVFDKVDGYLRKYDETKDLALFHLKNLKEYLTELDILQC